MAKVKDLTDRQFHELKVICRARNVGKQVAWLCECSCGNRKVIMGCHLKSGTTKSCGHLLPKAVSEATTKHGMFGTRLYKIFDGMKQRCYNRRCKGYKNYGARGIVICDEWLQNPSAFFEWSLQNGYADFLSIDRIDNDGNYEPSNCRWSTDETQHNNMRSNRFLEYKGEVHTMAEWCRALGLNYHTVKTRLNVLHWSVDKAFEYRSV